MIKNASDLAFFIKNDMAANGFQNPNKIKRWLRYRINLILGYENAAVVRYLRCLRKYEYFLNIEPNFFRKILRKYYMVRLSKLSLKYSIRIWPNCIESGLRIPHIAGGGDYQRFTYG